MDQPTRFSDSIRAAVKASEHSANAVARAAEIDRGAMSKFLAGKRGLSLDSIDRLAEFLGLRVCGPESGKPKRVRRATKKSATTKRKG